MDAQTLIKQLDTLANPRARNSRTKNLNQKELSRENDVPIEDVLSLCNKIIQNDFADRGLKIGAFNVSNTYLSELTTYYYHTVATNERIGNELLIEYAKFIRAVCYVKKADYEMALTDFKSLGYTDYWIYKQSNTQLYKEMVNYNVGKRILDKKDEDFSAIQKYVPYCETIYNYIFQILDQLIVKEGRLVSHYTGRKIVEKLIFEKSMLRLCSMATANDTSEGRIFYELLGYPEWYDKLIEKNKYQCFITCFTFDSNCLNHFRLYGKDNEKEATGVSICFESDVFDCLVSNQLKFEKYDIFCKKHITFPLFRTIYAYPEEGNITSIGHTEHFEKLEEKENLENMMIDEKKIAKNTPEEIKNKIKKLKEEIELFINIDKNLKSKENRIDIVSEMLLNLSYIVKHAAFKEEQECRLFTVQELRRAKHIHFCDKFRKMYVEYQLPVNEIKRITFAPKASEYLLFKDRLEQIAEEFKKDVACIQSKLPIA